MDDDFFAALIRFDNRLAPTEIRVYVAERYSLPDWRYCKNGPCPVCVHQNASSFLYLCTLARTRLRPISIAVETSAGNKPSITALAQSAVPVTSRAWKNSVAIFIRFTSFQISFSASRASDSALLPCPASSSGP
jgi:hypothetical protein